MVSCQARCGLGVADLRRGGLRGFPSGFPEDGQGNIASWQARLRYLIGLSLRCPRDFATVR